jgi:hypothetical protein
MTILMTLMDYYIYVIIFTRIPHAYHSCVDSIYAKQFL